MIQRFKPKSEFLRNVITLMTGTTIAQALPILVSPILTRLYSPEDFGIFALYLALSTTLALIATGRYELAVILPENDEEAANVFALPFILALGVSSVTFLLFLSFKKPLAALLKNDEIERWLMFVPVMVFLTASYQVLNYWSNRRKKFRRLATNRVWLSLVTAAANLGMGFAHFGASGLIVGAIIGQTFSTGLLAVQIWREDRHYAVHVKRSRIREQAKRYSSFPKYSVFADLTNTVANQMPIILLTSFFSPHVSGMFSLTQRVLAKPDAVLSDAVLEVFKQRASSEYAQKGHCEDLFLRTMKQLVLISIIPFTILFLFAPWLFAKVFGEQWREAGEFARIMTFMFAFRFTVSPVSYILYIAQKQKYDLYWQAGLLTLTTAGLYGGHLLNSPRWSISLFTASYSLMYVIYAFMSYHFSKGGHRPHPGGNSKT